MKTLSILKKIMVLGALILFVNACEKNEIEDVEQTESSAQQNVKVSPTDADVLPTEVSKIAVEVAKIQKNGHEYTFVALGDNDDMVVLEKLYGEAEKNVEDSNMNGLNPFELFTFLTDASVSVPNRIAITAEESTVNNSRRQISTSIAPVEILDPNFVETTSRMACYDVGYTAFRNTHCGGTPVVSTPSDIRFCDNGTRTSLTRSSYYGGDWKELDDIQTRTNVICGITRLQFYAWQSSGIWPFNNWAWNLYYQVDLQNGIWYINRYTSTNTERRVKRTVIGNTGKFRAYTRFF